MALTLNQTKVLSRNGRQARYEAKNAFRVREFEGFRDELREALARGPGRLNLEHGPSDPTEWMQWATERLRGMRLTSYPVDERKRKPRKNRERPLSFPARAALNALAEGGSVRQYRRRAYLDGRPLRSQVWEMVKRREYVRLDGQRWVISELGRRRLQRK